MTDKEIIIDGADVSKCENYSKHRDGYCGWYVPCEGESCWHKIEWALEKLTKSEARVKQLEEELNAQFAEMEEKITEVENKNFELKEEIKELRDLNRRLDNQREEYWQEYLKLDKKLKIAESQMTLARDIAYDSSQSEPVRVQIDEILTQALKQMEKAK